MGQDLFEAHGVGVRVHGANNRAAQAVHAAAKTAEQLTHGGDVPKSLGQEIGQTVNFPEGAQVSKCEKAVADEHTQHVGQATPAIVKLMPMDGSGGHGVSGGAVQGARCPVILAGQDVPGDKAQVESTAVQMMGGVHC